MSESKYQLEDLIGSLCSTGSENLDVVQLKQIKTICRVNDENCQYSYAILMNQLNKEHSEVRYSALQIIDCLFQRSHVFRELLLENFQVFFELVLETDPDNPLPPPIKKAPILKKLAAKTIKTWHEKFSDIYKLLDLGFNYLKNCKKVDFVSFSHQTNAQRVHQAKETQRQEIFMNKKYLEYVKDMQDNKPEILSCISQLERCFEILKPNDLFDSSDFNLSKPGLGAGKTNIIATEEDNCTSEMAESDSDSDDDFEEVPSKNQQEEEEIELRYLGFLNDKSSEYNRNFELQLTVDRLKIDEENRVLVDIMRDLNKELKNSYLEKIKDWIKNFNLVKKGQKSLKEAIELKNSVQEILKKYAELHIPEIESKKTEIITETVDESQPCTSKSKEPHEERELTEHEIKRKNKKKEMLKIAPVINLDEVEFCRTVTQQVEADHRFYGRSSADTEIDYSARAQQVKTTFTGKFEPVKWACRAPLVKSGKLCPRKDRFKCPIHGKIVARDELGQIINESDKTSENTPEPVKPWLDMDLINDINAATGKKVIDMDKKKKKGKIKGNLTDVSKEDDSPRKRLERKLFTAKSLNKVGMILDGIEKRLYNSRFHHQYNYSLQS